MDTIFGYTWEQIQAMQQKRGGVTIDTTLPGRKPASKEDFELGQKYGGLDNLKAAGLFGVADRLEYSILLAGECGYE